MKVTELNNQKEIMKPEIPKWLKRLPNQLTILRILCIPLLVVLMNMGDDNSTNFTPQLSDKLAGIVFAIAAGTDFFDGWIARKFNVETLFGKLLDPLADKLLVISALIILVEKHRMHGWIAVIFIVRDLAINAIRISALEEGVVVNSNWTAKTKTFLMDVAIAGLCVNGWFLGLPMGDIGLFFVWAALAASIISAIQYFYDYGNKLKTLSD